MADAKTGTHKFRFSRAGGFDQAQFRGGADFAALEQLDQKLWAALACPVKGLEFDERTLTLMDTDNDGRIRAPEVIGALQWAEEHMTDLGALLEGSATLPLSRIKTTSDSGQAIFASAKRILTDHGKGDATEISLDLVTDTAALFAATVLNGDGIVPADSSGDESIRKVIGEVIDCVGAEDDRSGKPGVDTAKLDRFFAESAAVVEWSAKPEDDAALLPLGDATAAASAAVLAVRAKVDDFFTRCRLAAFDARALGAVNRGEAEYTELAKSDLSADAHELAGFPLAHVEAGKSLPLASGVNPAWADAIATLRAAAVEPLLGGTHTELTEGQWKSVTAKLAPFETWQAAKPATGVEKLGVERLKEIASSEARSVIADLIAADLALKPEFEAIEQVERLLRYHRDLNELCRNFVNFSTFYQRQRPAVFQAGTLYLDGRACSLVVRVGDAGKHAALAGLAKVYLAYCDCTRLSGEKMQIAAAFTDGDSDYLMVGRNGVFYDRQGRDWDATITKVIDNPISIRQAFWAPYKKLVRMIEERVAKRAAAADAESDKKLAATASAAASVDKTAAAASATPPTPSKKVDVGAVAAMGVAIGALGMFFTALVNYVTDIFGHPFWVIVLIVLGIFVLISTPSMLIAWLKLRQRNLGPILDANGWAVNGRVKLTVRFGKTLTAVGKAPAGSAADAEDKYADKPSVLPRLIVFVVAVCFVASLLNEFGLIHKWSKGKLGDPRKLEVVVVPVKDE